MTQSVNPKIKKEILYLQENDKSQKFLKGSVW